MIVVTAVLCVSLGSILVRLAQAPALAVAFYRVGLASLLLLPLQTVSLTRGLRVLTPRDHLSLLGAGLALGLHFATWIESLSFTSIASSVLIVNTAPLMTLVLSRAFLSETPPATTVGAIGIAFLGALLIAWGDSGRGPAPIKGDLLAGAGALMLSVYHIAGRALRKTLPLGAYVLAVWATAAVLLFFLAVGFRVPLTGYPPRTLLVFCGLALIPTLGGHGLVNRALRSLDAPTVGLFMLGEPVFASILAYFLFKEVPPGRTLLGGGVVLVGLALAIGRTR